MSAAIIKTAMNEAYWQAARAMCSRCADGWRVFRRHGGFVHQVGSQGVEMVEEFCWATPIHALIEKLNGVQE